MPKGGFNLKPVSRVLLLMMVGCFILGCVHQPLVRHDEVLIYNRSFDSTYEAVMRAVDALPPWTLGGTEKEQGIVMAYNRDYGDAFDADKRTVNILVQRMDRRKTLVKLDPASQSIIGAGDLLKSIDYTLGRYRE